MSADGGRAGRPLGAALAGLSLLYAGLLFYGLGPKPEGITNLPWYAPREFIYRAIPPSLSLLVTNFWVGLLAFTLPALALAAGVFRWQRSALARTLAICSAVGAVLVAYWGYGAARAWTFFHWRWSATLLLSALALGCALSAPLLAGSWLRRSWPVRLALYLPVAFVVVVIMRDVTGTDPRLFLALSPWPAFSWFTLEIGGGLVGCLLALLALGLLSARAWRSNPLAALLGLGLAVAIPALAVATRLGLEREIVALGLCVAAGVLVVDLAAERPTGAARHTAVGALLVLLPIFIGAAVIERDHAVSRDERAVAIMAGLERYYQREQGYPDELATLVETGDLAAIPAPRVGFGFRGRSRFDYQNFGLSYLLEFSAPRWVQCAYSSPYAEDPDGEDGEQEEPIADEADGDDEETLEGAWSCPTKPPELW